MWWKKTGNWFGQHCSRCKKMFTEYELFPVLGLDGKTKFYCPDCIVGHVEWCEVCGEPFEVGTPGKKVCKECEAELCMMSQQSKTNSEK